MSLHLKKFWQLSSNDQLMSTLILDNSLYPSSEKFLINQIFTGPFLSPVRKDTSVSEQPWCCLTSRFSSSSSLSSPALLCHKPPPVEMPSPIVPPQLQAVDKTPPMKLLSPTPHSPWLQQHRSCRTGPSSWCGTCPRHSVRNVTRSSWTWKTSTSWRTGSSASRERWLISDCVIDLLWYSGIATVRLVQRHFQSCFLSSYKLRVNTTDKIIKWLFASVLTFLINFWPVWGRISQTIQPNFSS